MRAVRKHVAVARSFVVIVFLLLLLVPASFVVFVEPVAAASTIYISADGSVVGTDRIERNGDVYVFIGDVNDSIVVQKDNIVVDGAGFTLQGPGGIFGTTAIKLSTISNVTIRNIWVTDFYHGIILSGSSNVSIYGNHIVEVPVEAIGLSQSSNFNSIFDNRLNTYNGIVVTNSSGNLIYGNGIEKDMTGVSLSYSSGNEVFGNNITGGLGASVSLQGSDGNVFSENRMAGFGGGFSLSDSNNNGFYENDVVGNEYGFRLDGSSSNVISGNDILESAHEGIWLNYSSSNFVYRNNFVNNTEQASSLNSTNTWDGGTPLVGNFWSDYSGVDQDEDGIGDTPYVIDALNQDSHPLVVAYQEEYLLTIGVVGSGAVNLNVSGPFPFGSVVELTAVPEAGWSFSEWSGDLSGWNNPKTIIMNGDRFVNATFQVANAPPYQPQLSISPSAGVNEDDDLGVNVVGPVPADPDGDAVVYIYRWFVNVGSGFVDDEAAGRGNHSGSVVPAADTLAGDVWRVEVTPTDEDTAVGSSANATWQSVVAVDTESPVADAGSDLTVDEDVVVSFNAAGSSDNVGIVSYGWSFGDGSSGSGLTVTHVYSQPGTYTATLTVGDAAGNSDTDSVRVTVRDVVEEPQPPNPPATSDSDGDGFNDNVDAFPFDSTETVDTDGDGVGNNADSDDDNDGVADVEDAFPLDALESGDADGDGIGDNADTDDDNDGVLDVDDAFPLDTLESVDTDGDGVGNNADQDDDGDGLPDDWEIYNGFDPLEASDASWDSDGDGLTNLQEYELNLNPRDEALANDVQTVSVVAGLVVGFAAVTGVVLANLASFVTAFDSAVSNLPVPEELKEFLQLYGEKLFERVDKVKLATLEKAPFISKGEIAALGISALISTVVFGVVEAKGFAIFLTSSGVSIFVAPALVSVLTVIVFSELFEACCARFCRVHKQFKLWMYGLVMFVLSGLVFLFPIGSPGITRYKTGEISDRAKGLFVLSKTFLFLTLMIPFAALLMLGFSTLGGVGLWLTLVTVFASLIPVRPLAGKELFNYRKGVSLAALVFSGIILFIYVYGNLTRVIFLPYYAYLAVGVVSVFLAVVALFQLRKAH